MRQHALCRRIAMLSDGRFYFLRKYRIGLFRNDGNNHLRAKNYMNERVHFPQAHLDSKSAPCSCIDEKWTANQ